MADQTIHLRMTRTQVRQVVQSLPSEMRASGPVQLMTMVACGKSLLSHIQTSFLIKAAGGTDEAGERWPPLSPATIAYRRAKRTRTEKRRESHPSQALTKRQRDRWWEVYRRALGRIISKQRVRIRQENAGKRIHPDQAAVVSSNDRGRAAAIAWIVLKREGATTLLEKYGNQRVDIMRDTSLLYNSLSPDRPNAHQVFRVAGGAVTVGTNREGALANHHGAPSRNLPQRRLWPAVSKWPNRWWRDITNELKTGLTDLLTYLLGRSGGK